MSVYSSPLLGLTNAAPAGNPYQSAAVPVNAVFVVRDISGILHGGGASQVYVKIWQPGPSTIIFLYQDNSSDTGVNQNIHWEGRVVLSPGWKLEVDVGEGTVDLEVSGYSLSNY